MNFQIIFKMTNMSFANGSGNLNVNLNFVKTLSEITTKKTDSLLVVGQAKENLIFRLFPPV